MKFVGIIDIGSNSMRLVLVRFNKDNSYRIIDDVKHSVRLGKDMLPNGSLHPVRMQKALDALRFFKNLCDAVGVNEIIVVATEAVRKASNQKEFLAMIKEATGLSVRILKGEEEAFYDYFSVVNTFDLEESLIMDIGGSSTELIWMKDRKIQQVISLPFGTITLADLLSEAKGNAVEKEKTVAQMILSKLGTLNWLPKGTTLIGIGGSFRNVAKIDQKKIDYPMEQYHNYGIPPERVMDIHKLLVKTPANRRKEIKGISSDRADILWGATTAISSVIAHCGIRQVLVSGSGLREGVIYEQVLPDFKPIDNVLEFSLKDIMTDFSLNENHALHIQRLSSSLLQQLASIHKYDLTQAKILKAASLLHDCGINISYYDHHMHSFYMIMNSQINGMSHKEQMMSAYVAASHRKNNVKIAQAHKGFLSEEEQKVIRKLGVILRICESLDRRMNGAVWDVECLIDSDSVILRLQSDDDYELEASEALSCAEPFYKEFGKKLQII